MVVVNELWSKLTQTKMIEESRGPVQTAFYEAVYRVVYLTGHSTSDRGLYLIYRYCLWSLLGVLILGEVWCLVNESDLDGILVTFNVVLIQAIAIYRYNNMINHKSFFENLAAALQSSYFDISTESRKNILKYWIACNEKFLKILLALGSCTLSAWYIYPLVDDIEYNLVVAVRFPFEYETPTRYPIVYVLTAIAFNFSSFFVMVTDLIMQAHLLNLLCQFAVLADCFENLLTDCRVGFCVDSNQLLLDKHFTGIYNKRLEELVIQHKFLLSKTIELRSILSIPMLFQFAVSTMLICFVAYQVTETISVSITKCLMSLLYLGYNMFQLFILCRWCDEIKTQCENIRDAVYSSGWESGVGAARGVRTRLLLVLTRAGKPVVLSAGGIYDLSLTSYTTLVKTSYSALTVLLRMRQ